MVSISQMFGNDSQLYKKLASNIGFQIHVAIPAIVQSFNAEKQTVDVQPVIKERVIGQTGEISYMQYPLLINVPVAFQQAGDFIFSFKISRGDECVVLFSDLPLDSWWLAGGVQNPIEQRRHDLSDGIAIFGLSNQQKLSMQNEDTKPTYSEAQLTNTKNGVQISIGEDDITLSAMVVRKPVIGPPTVSLESCNVSSLIQLLNP